MLHFRESWNEERLASPLFPPGACHWPKSGIMTKALFNCRSGVDACAGGSRRPRKFEGREGAVVGAQEAVKNIAIKVISRDRTRSVHAVRNGRNRARRVKLGEGRLLRTRRQAQPQRAEGEGAAKSGCVVIGSAPLHNPRSILSMTRKLRAGFICCGRACGGWTNDVAIKRKTVQK